MVNQSSQVIYQCLRNQKNEVSRCTECGTAFKYNLKPVVWKIIEQFLNMRFFFPAIFGLLSFGSALKCENGSIPDLKSICIRPKYIEGCYSYASQQACAQCNYNYNLEVNTGLCAYNANTAESCCLELDGKNCKKCNRGLSLVNGSCVQTESLGCLEKTTTGECTNCASDFVLDNGKCLQGIRNCHQYADSTRKTCDKCYHSYSLVGNYCLKNKILGCKTEENGACVTCFDPFKPNDGQCQIKHCKEYNDFGCQSCECGFFITRKMTCDKVEQGCVRYQKGICTDCFPPFTLQGTVCTIDGCNTIESSKCTKCNDGYNLQDGLCSLPNCLKGKNGKCEICKQGFNYSNGQCTSSSPKYVFSS